MVNGRQVAALLGVGPKSLEGLRRQPGFPQPVRLNARVLRWFQDEVEAYLDGLAAARQPA
jgi:predicted DNA-binding transcriptional regulator AlpA